MDRKKNFFSPPVLFSVLYGFTGRFMPSPWTNPASKISQPFYAKTGIDHDSFFFFLCSFLCIFSIFSTNGEIEISCVA